MKLRLLLVTLLISASSLFARTPLIQAIIDEDVNGVLKNLHTNKMINVRDSKYGFTPLTLALLQENNEIIKLLINAGANLRAYESIEALKLVTDHKMVQDKTNTKRIYPAIFIAAMTGNKESLELIYKKNKAVVFQKDYDGNTILSWSAFQGKMKIVKLLLSYGFDPLLKNFNSKNAINFASVNKHHAIIKLFVVDMIKMGTNKSNLTKVFFEEIDNRDYHLLEFLLKNGIDVNAKFRRFTPFLKAAKNGDVLMLEFLVKHGANAYEVVQKRNVHQRYYNYDALSLAIKYGRDETILFLLDNFNYDVNKRVDGKNYLHLIVSSSTKLKAKTFETLLSKMNVNVNEKDSKGNTLLHNAVLSANEYYIKFLGSLEQIKVNTTNKDNLTALQLAEKLYLKNESAYKNDESEKNFKELKIREKSLESLYLVTITKE